ncbi:MAG: hypothetical protein O2995_14265 [Proteobacteria bacterium]|nr:hypothetical protein [Pseudomonadota bacterium]
MHETSVSAAALIQPDLAEPEAVAVDLNDEHGPSGHHQHGGSDHAGLCAFACMAMIMRVGDDLPVTSAIGAFDLMVVVEARALALAPPRRPPKHLSI